MRAVFVKIVLNNLTDFYVSERNYYFFCVWYACFTMRPGVGEVRGKKEGIPLKKES